MYKIIIDSFRKENKEHAKVIINDKEVIAYGTLLPLIILVILLVVKFNQLFRINFILLVLFMLLRSLKEEFKYHRNRLIK